MIYKRLTTEQIIEQLNDKFPMHKCVVCETEKVCTNYREYAWKLNNKYCCSYTCFRILEKEKLKNIKKNTLCR